MNSELLDKVHPEWQPLVESSLVKMDSDYLQQLMSSKDWLPGSASFLNAFSHPLSTTEYVLFGESPYPRDESANGYAFWDENVREIWSETGLSKQVNRATSLRNILKMLLVARGCLSEDLSQMAISKIDKSPMVTELSQLFQNFINKGFLLLNASLVLSSKKVTYDAKHWQVFMDHLLLQLSEVKPSIKLILFGKIANRINDKEKFNCLIVEHPYNLSFIRNENVIEFFKPLDLLKI